MKVKCTICHGSGHEFREERKAKVPRRSGVGRRDPKAPCIVGGKRGSANNRHRRDERRPGRRSDD